MGRLICLLLSIALLLAGCATAPKKHCVTTPCGDVCCNNDGLICPPCWKEKS